MKQCAACAEYLPDDRFGLSPRRRDGVLAPRRRCKECERAATARWRKQNPESVRAANARYYAENREQELERNRSKDRDWSVKNCKSRTGQPVPWTKKALIQLHGAKCHLCLGAIDLSLKWPDPMSISVEHVVPVSCGGSNEWDNVRLAHVTCNCRKHDGSRGQALTAEAW